MSQATRLLIKKKLHQYGCGKFEVLAKRLAKRHDRPLLQTHDPQQTLKALIKKRYPVYIHADLVVNAEDDGVDITVSKVVECLSDYYCYSKKSV